MPGAEAHINVDSQDRAKWWWTFPDITPANSDDDLCRDSTVRSESRITARLQLCAESPINPNSNLEIQVTLLPSHDGNRQSIWWSCQPRNEFSKMEIAMSTRSSPTDKSKPIKKSTEQSTEKSTKILLKPPIESTTMKLTGWSPSWTLNDDYRVNATYRWQLTEIFHKTLHEGSGECKCTWTC